MSEDVGVLGKFRAARWWGKHRAELLFVVSFLVIASILFSLYSFPYPDGSTARQWSDAYIQGHARVAGWVLSLLDRRGHIGVSGQNITGRYSLRIVRGCDAVDAQILLVSAVLASSTQSWRWRASGAVAGFLAVGVANIVRICSLYYVGIFLPAQFDLFHHELWPLLLIALAAGVFLLWSGLATSHGSAARATQ